jgi:hypothetical protein
MIKSVIEIGLVEDCYHVVMKGTFSTLKLAAVLKEFCDIAIEAEKGSLAESEQSCSQTTDSFVLSNPNDFACDLIMEIAEMAISRFLPEGTACKLIGFQQVPDASDDVNDDDVSMQSDVTSNP